MPTYEYKCERCLHRFEVWQKITDNPLKRCPRCRGKLTRIPFPAGVIFKGSGFYITDSRKEKEKVKSKDKKSEVEKSKEPLDTKKSGNQQLSPSG